MNNRETYAAPKRTEPPRSQAPHGAAAALPIWLRDPRRLLYLVIFVAIATLLATRPLGLALDDLAYLDYLDNADWFEFIEYVNQRGYFVIVEEPLWQILAHILSLYFDSEVSLRLVIFCSVLLYAWAFRKAPSAALIFVLFAFVACPSLFGQAYFNQLRQGLAISIFLAFLSLGDRGYLFGSIASGLVHTSQFGLLPSYVKSIKGIAISAVAVLAGWVLFFTGMLQSFMGNANLGRREAQYAFEGALNLRFYVVALPLYFGMLGFIWYEQRRLKRPSEVVLLRALTFCVFVFAISLAHEAAGRLFYMMDALVVWTICRHWSGRVAIAAWLWGFAQVVLGIYLSQLAGPGENAWLSRIEAIFGSW